MKAFENPGLGFIGITIAITISQHTSTALKPEQDVKRKLRTNLDIVLTHI